MDRPCYCPEEFVECYSIEEWPCDLDNTWEDCPQGKLYQDLTNKAKTAKARKIREEICNFLDVQLSIRYMDYPYIKAQLTRIIKKRL
jgi:hypothetical protein